MLENFEDHEFLNGQNFSKIADVVFTINVPNEELSSFNIEDYKIITKNTEFTGLKIKNLSIKNGDVVFCNSSYLSLFFKYLKRLKHITSITLITSQSDFSITKKVFKNRPESITQWYAVNVAFENLIYLKINFECLQYQYSYK